MLFFLSLRVYHTRYSEIFFYDLTFLWWNMPGQNVHSLQRLNGRSQDKITAAATTTVIIQNTSAVLTPCQALSAFHAWIQSLMTTFCDRYYLLSPFRWGNQGRDDKELAHGHMAHKSRCYNSDAGHRALKSVVLTTTRLIMLYFTKVSLEMDI